MTTERRRAFVALAATLAIQVFTALAATAAAVLAPEIAQTFAIETKWVGVFVGVVYAGAMVGSLASGGFIERYGAMRVSQAAALVCAAGTASIAIAPDSLPALLGVAAILIGIGYGPITPASSHVLIRTAPPDRLALTFSIKQTGVPAGAALAGAALPTLVLVVGWRVALLVTALLGVVVAAAAQGPRAMLDRDRRPEKRVSPLRTLDALRTVFRTPALTELALIGFAYAATQVCLTSFLVVYLHETLHWSLVASGLALTAATLGGVVGRIIWGIAADRAFQPRTVLASTGVIASACGVLTALADVTWPTPALIAIAAAYGASAIGWNGVQLSEVARLAPKGDAAKITGASGFITFFGVVVGPPIFALLAGVTGSYRAGFAIFSVISACAALALVRPGRRPESDS